MVLHNIYELIQTQINGGTFVGIDTVTEVRTRKTMPDNKKEINPHHGQVFKLTAGSRVMVFQNKHINAYDAMVRRRLEEEGKDPASFELQPRKWGERIPGTPFIRHVKDGEMKYYLEVIYLSSGDVTFYYNAKPIARDEIIGLQESAGGEQGGLSNKVIIRTIAVENITKLTINKQTYTDLFFKLV